MRIDVEWIAIGITLLLAFVMGQLAAMFRSRAGRWWATAYLALAAAESLRFVQWTTHLIAETTFVVVLSFGCHHIQRTRYWRRKSTMYMLLVLFIISVDAAQASAQWNGMATGNLAVADIALSMVLGCMLILLMAEAAHWRLSKTVSDIHDARQQLQQRLHTDLLTEALSRHAFRWMQQGSEIATEGELTGVVVMFDVDGLKSINDTFGHHVGDGAIRAAANAIRSVIRPDDLLYRWGGDEVAAILPNLRAPLASEPPVAVAAPLRAPLSDQRSHAGGAPGAAHRRAQLE